MPINYDIEYPKLQRALTEQRAKNQESVRIVNAINELTDKEVTSVKIHHANPDFDGPAYVIDCNGYWTGYQDTRFEGETQIEALEKAVIVKRAYDQGRTPKCDPSSLQ